MAGTLLPTKDTNEKVVLITVNSYNVEKNNLSYQTTTSKEKYKSDLGGLPLYERWGWTSREGRQLQIERKRQRA